jgi:putative transposase
MVHIPPRCPWDNGYIESFNNRLRKKCLNRNYWNTLFEARVVIGDFKAEHTTRHRHSALGDRTPAAYPSACSAPTPRRPSASTENGSNPTRL